MSDGYLSGRTYGYDQIGSDDSYYNMNSQRYSTNIADILNINTPVHTHTIKQSPEQASMEQNCQELLFNIYDNRNELKQLNKKIENISEKKIENFPAGANNYFGDLFGEKYFHLFIFIILIFIIFQIQQTNELLKILIHDKMAAR